MNDKSEAAEAAGNVALGVSNFDFSMVSTKTLKEARYVLAHTVVDITGSVSISAEDILRLIKDIIREGQHPKVTWGKKALLSISVFNDAIGVKQLFPFMPPIDLNIDNFKLTTATYFGQIVPAISVTFDGKTTVYPIAGGTNLYDAVIAGQASLIEAAHVLVQQDFDANLVLITITDGEDNRSQAPLAAVTQLFADLASNKEVESVQKVLAGLQTDQPATEAKNRGKKIEEVLQAFAQDAKFDQYISSKEITSGVMMKLAKFVSSSIGGAANALGTGQKSQNVDFIV